MKEAKRFTRDNPCTKIDLHNAFIGPDGYEPCTVVDFKMRAGDNAIKYLVKSDYARMVNRGAVDYYELTEEGEEWLRDGLVRFLELHPDRAADVLTPARAAPTTPTRRRIIRGRV